MTLWISKTNSAGWTYGYGEYKKSLVSMVKMPAYQALASGALAPWLNAYASQLHNLGDKLLAEAAKRLDSYTALPTYYLWMKSPAGVKTIGGQWNLFTGGKSKLLSWWPVFDKCMSAGTASTACIALTWAWPAVVSAGTVAQRVSRTRQDPATASGDTLAGNLGLPLAIAGAAVLFVLLK